MTLARKTALAAVISLAAGFAPMPASVSSPARHRRLGRPRVVAFAAPEDDDSVSAAPPTIEELQARAGGVVPDRGDGDDRKAVTVADLSPASNYPQSGGGGDDVATDIFRIPSYLALLLASVLAIASVGSVFELMKPDPATLTIGVPATIAVLVTALPASAWTFYLSIANGQLEQVEDDERNDY